MDHNRVLVRTSFKNNHTGPFLTDKPPIELVSGSLSRVTIPISIEPISSLAMPLTTNLKQAYLWLTGAMVLFIEFYSGILIAE